MRFSLSVAMFGSVLLLSVVPTCAARAEAPSSEAAGEARRAQAKLEFKRGSELFSAGQYQRAVAAFMAADRLAPSAALSFNIALAYEQLADISGALRWYRDYVRRNPRAPNAATVQTRINELSGQLSRSGLQQLTVVSTPTGATVMVDGRAVGVTPFTGDLALGQHRLQLDLPGYREPGRQIALAPSGPQDLSVALDSLPPATQKIATTAGPSSLDHDGPRRFGIAPWLVAGGGVLGLGSALGFELARRSDEEAAENATNQIDFKTQSDALTRHQTTARVLGGVGGALFVTGSVLMLFNERTPSAPHMGLDCTMKGCTASATGSF
jgi:tetratricopeptide (TPR) repeat protein